jgi:hypothetical protein
MDSPLPKPTAQQRADYQQTLRILSMSHQRGELDLAEYREKVFETDLKWTLLHLDSQNHTTLFDFFTKNHEPGITDQPEKKQQLLDLIFTNLAKMPPSDAIQSALHEMKKKK